VTTKIGFILCFVALGIIFGFFFGIVDGHQAEAHVQGQAMRSAPDVITPSLVAVTPSEAPNNLDVTLTLTGTDFQAVLSGTEVLTAPAVSLDGFALPAVGWVNSSSLTATVPWGLDAGIYTVTVTNPDGGAAWLTNAFTVEQAIGVTT